MYDVTRRETFTNLSDVWAKEVDLYSTNQDCVKMLVGNKVDRVSTAFSLLCLKFSSLTKHIVVTCEQSIRIMNITLWPAFTDRCL